MIHQSLKMAAVTLLVGVSSAWGQVQTEPAVTGDGSVTVTLQPEVMRLRIDLLAKGKDLKEAMTKLKERRETARKKIIEMGASEKTIDIAAASLSAGKTDERRQMEMMVRARMAGRKADKEKEAKPQPVTVSATLTAEWPIKTQDNDELLLMAQELQEKIKAADLAGLKDMEAKSTEEEEEEEAESPEEVLYSGDQGPKPGEPAFVFVARIPADRLDKATAEAFEKARAKALRLAKAAGVLTGNLRFLSSHQRPDYDRMSRYRYAYGSYFQELIQQSYSAEGADAEEAIGAEPGPVTFRVTVTASFEIK